MTPRVFLHTGAPCQGCAGIGDYWRQLDAAGVPFAVYSVEGGGLIAEAAAFPGATLIYRTLRTDVAPYDLAPDAAARFVWETLMAHLPPEVRALKSRVWIEIGNEQDKTRADWLGHYYAELAAIAMPAGYNICGPGWSTGEPEPIHWNLPGWARYLELCAAHPARLGITLHEYSLSADDIMSGSPWLVGRVQFLMDACKAQGIRPPTVFITEAGWTHNDLPHAEKAKADIAALAELYAGYPTVKAAFLWTLMGGGDKKTLAAELNVLMPWLAQYTINTEFPDVAEPPTEPTDPPPAPAVNQLRNPSFEDGWTDSGIYTTTQNPRDWTVEWNVGPDFPNPHGGQVYLLGEGVHKSKAMLPPAERDVFVWDGDWTYKLFAGDRSFWARLKQTLDLPAGRYQLETPVWVDCYRWSGFKDYAVEPWQAETMVKANGREVKAWSLMVSGTRARPVTVFDHAGGPCALAVHFRCNWAISNNLWLDGWSLTAMPVAPPPPPPPPTAPVKLLDISKWQGTIDAAKMKAAGVDGVMVRASYAGINGSTADEKVDEFIPLLKAAGIPYGLYHYFHPARPVQEQFDAFQGVVARHGYGLRLALDLEETAGLDGATATKAAAFGAMMREAFPLPDGKRHLIYTSLGYWRDRLGSPAWGAEYDLWIAAWTQAAAPTVPAPWNRWTLWQHANDGNGPAHGVASARVDLNRFNGSAADFAAWQVAGGTVAAELWAKGQATQTVNRNPSFALERAMIAAGFYPVGNETRVTAGGTAYAVHLGANAAATERLYIAKAGEWSNVWYQEGPGAVAPTPPPDDRIDLLPYLRGDGRLYEVRHPDGTTETFQTQAEPDAFYLVKNSQWEELYAGPEYIWRGVDTSPGGGRFYIQFEPGMKRARWMPRRMRVGEAWVGPGHMVQFYDKATCAPSAANSGNATNRMVFVARHTRKVWNGIAVDDVVELTNGSETWFYARGFGLVAWSAGWGQSAIVQVYAPGERPNLVRERLNCQV